MIGTPSEHDRDTVTTSQHDHNMTGSQQRVDADNYSTSALRSRFGPLKPSPPLRSTDAPFAFCKVLTQSFTAGTLVGLKNCKLF